MQVRTKKLPHWGEQQTPNGGSVGTLDAASVRAAPTTISAFSFTSSTTRDYVQSRHITRHLLK